MQKIEELELYKYLLLTDPANNIKNIIFHVINLGRELQKLEDSTITKISELPVLASEFNYLCDCELCARSKAYSDICYLLSDYIFLRIRDHIDDSAIFTISTIPNISTSLIKKSCKDKNNIEIDYVTQCKHPHHVEITFSYTGKIKTEFIQRGLPAKFSAIFDLRHSEGWEVFYTANEFIEKLKDIKFLNEHELTETTSSVLQCLFESLPKKFKNI